MKKIALTLSLILLFCLQSTHAQAQCCTYRLAMHDSYGDGWDGAFLEVLINNVSLGTYTATGFGTVATFQVCNGDSLELVYTAGQYENEHSTNILLEANFPRRPEVALHFPYSFFLRSFVSRSMRLGGGRINRPVLPNDQASRILN